jgi:hypothetical protein
MIMMDQLGGSSFGIEIADAAALTPAKVDNTLGLGAGR